MNNISITKFQRLMKPMLKGLLAVVIMSVVSITAHANNLQITNVSYNSATNVVEFDLYWENSWRTSVTQPYNYDGVWLFVKARETCEKESDNPGPYYHAWLDNSGSATTSTMGDLADLTVELSTTNVAATPRGMGVFVYRTNDCSAADTINTHVTLTWDIATQAGVMPEIDAAATYDVNVYGVEMIYVPQGEFYLGDGASSNCFYDLAQGTSTPYYVDTENGFFASGALNRAISASTGVSIHANFPKGFDPFWIMKYEITQLQYAEFLNALTPDQAQSRTESDLYSINGMFYVMRNQNSGTPPTPNGERQGIILDPQGDKRTDKFYVNQDGDGNYNEPSDGAGIACNYLSVRDVLAYLDWAALRPLTEMEYEKACRGPVYPQLNEYAWGSIGVVSTGGYFSGGSAVEQANNTGTGLCNYNNDAEGPMRVGFAATQSTNRAQAGCTYYGVMDMSGNVFEPYVSFHSTNSVTGSFQGQPGDGELDTDGFHNVTGWPSHVADNDVDKFIPKGGNWRENQTYLRVSRRNDNNRLDSPAEISGRNQDFGGRGGR